MSHSQKAEALASSLVDASAMRRMVRQPTAQVWFKLDQLAGGPPVPVMVAKKSLRGANSVWILFRIEFPVTFIALLRVDSTPFASSACTRRSGGEKGLPRSVEQK